MNDSPMRHFSRIHAAEREADETDDDLGAFGLLRGQRRAITIQFRMKDGSIVGLSYAFLERVDYDPSGTITLHFARQSVKVIGKNLNLEIRPNVRLVDGLLRHRTTFIQESSRADVLTSTHGGPVIEGISIE
jgi:hypothetical protein